MKLGDYIREGFVADKDIIRIRTKDNHTLARGFWYEDWLLEYTACEVTNMRMDTEPEGYRTWQFWIKG